MIFTYNSSVVIFNINVNERYIVPCLPVAAMLLRLSNAIMYKG